MKYCPITYESISKTENYSQRGLRLLAPQLKALQPLNFNAAEQRREAIARAGKMSIQGVQTKVGAQLKIKEGCFELVDQFGHYILKPQSEHYPELPENEAITMTLAATIGIEVPVHGLLYSKDGSMTYFIKRFDRVGQKQKLAVEDFSQLLQLSPDTKYEGSMEKVASVIFKYCTFPKVEALSLLKLTLFNFLIGNEDMHLKNFSLITRGHKVQLAPAYDFLNTTIALGNAKEEIALPLKGKKNNLRSSYFLKYFAEEKLQLPPAAIAKVLDELRQAIPGWHELINRSFLSVSMRKKYLDLLNERCERFQL